MMRGKLNAIQRHAFDLEAFKDSMRATSRMRGEVSRLAKDYAALLPDVRDTYLKDWEVRGDKLSITCEFWNAGGRRKKYFTLPLELLTAPEPERTRRLLDLAHEARSDLAPRVINQRAARIAELQREIDRLKREEASDREVMTEDELARQKALMLTPEHLHDPNLAFNHHQTTAFICSEALRTGKPQPAAIAYRYRRYFVEITPEEAMAAASAWMTHSEIGKGKGYSALSAYLREDGDAAQKQVAFEKRKLAAARKVPGAFPSDSVYRSALAWAMKTHGEQRLIREWVKRHSQI